MTNCPLYNSANLDYTGNKFNNPYTLIQKAGRRKHKKTKKLIKRRKTMHRRRKSVRR